MVGRPITKPDSESSFLIGQPVANSKREFETDMSRDTSDQGAVRLRFNGYLFCKRQYFDLPQ